jgi:uncharacterized membrane protein YkvA (DUF1232 family)
MCQYLIGGLDKELEDSCREALEAFVAHGPGTASDKALRAAGTVIKRGHGPAETVLPSISKEKRATVYAQLESTAALGEAAIERAMSVLPSVRARISNALQSVLLPGIKHRFELVARILEDSAQSEPSRARAAAAVLYVENVNDVVPDTMGAIGMIDDDYALRVVLKELGLGQDSSILHWSERISSLWDDLPFLQGVNLQRGQGPISVTWLDRVNSYVSYLHVLSSEKAPLVLLQPSIICSPLHAIVSLIGLLVLDAVTSSQRKVDSLLVGQTYTFDRHVAIFEGVANDERYQGWLRLKFRNGNAYAHPTLAYQMVATESHRGLSDAGQFQAGAPGRDPLRRFFDWDSPIGPGSISSQVALVTSHRRALEMLKDVQSNGVGLLDNGLTRFLGARPDSSEVRGTVLLVVPSLSVARSLLGRGIHIHSVLVDGWERLQSGRHDLPFLINSPRSPPIVCWSTRGDFPSTSPSWLPAHKCLEASPDDLAQILELDDASADLAHASLWEAATGVAVQIRTTVASAAEVAVVDAIDVYLEAIGTSQALPDYWQYHLASLARALRLLIAATPAEWLVIRRFSSEWSSCLDEKWSSLRLSAVAALSHLREAEARVRKLIESVPDAVNSRAVALTEFLSDPAHTEGNWYLVCDRPAQVRVGASVVRALSLRGVEPVLLRDLTVCATCVITGWVSSSFARRLWAHTPRKVVALTEDSSRRRWEHAAEAQQIPLGQSLLAAVGRGHATPSYTRSPLPGQEDDHDERGSAAKWETEERVPCVFLWVSGESEAKVLQPDARVVVEDGEVVRERVAGQLRPDDRVILGAGTARWSPADEFTGAVIEAVGSSHPEVVQTAKEWRWALRRLYEMQQLSRSQLRARLAAVGVGREEKTIEGWVDLERTSPIAPRGLRNELAALWPLVEQYARHSLDEVAAACTRLRALRLASGRALLQLWKGQTVDLGVDETWLEELVDRLREEVQVYEVEAVGFGEVPRTMLGWWIPPALSGKFESEPAAAVVTNEDEEEADAGTD